MNCTVCGAPEEHFTGENCVSYLKSKLDQRTKERDAFMALVRRFVNFAIEMPSDMTTCLRVGNQIVVDAKKLLEEQK